jgi:hypothetical protein
MARSLTSGPPRWRRLVALALLVGIPLTAGTPATAQDDCDALLVDETGELDAGTVVAAAERLEDVALPRVRFYGSVPGGDLAASTEALIERCWPGPVGAIDPDLVLLAVSLGDRQTTLRWGPSLDPALAGRGDAIRDDVVNPRLAAGDLTRAVVAGLEAIEAELRAAPPPVGPPPPPTDEPVTGDGVPWLGLGAVGAVVAVGAGAVAFARRRTLVDRRRSIHEAMQEPLARAGDLRERGRQLELRAASLEPALAGGTRSRLAGLRSDARRAGDEVDAAQALLRGAVPSGLDEADHATLDQAEQRIVETVAAVAAHDAALSTLDRSLRRLEELRASLPSRLEVLDEEVIDTRDLLAQRAEEGWRTDTFVEALDRLVADANRVDLGPLSLDVDALAAEVDRIETELFRVRHSLQTLPERKAGLEAWADELAGSIALERERAAAARAELVRLAGQHDPTSFASLVDNPDVALAELDLAAEQQQAALAAPFAEQSWDEVERRLDLAGSHLLRADAELDEVDRSSVELEDARARGPQALAHAREVLDEVERFVTAHDDDLGPRFDTEPAAVAPVLVGLAHELERARPNHLRVVQTAEQVTADLDRLLAEARDEQARIAALRRVAAQEVAWATASVARARQALGWQLLPSREVDELRRLEESLAQLPDDPDARITAARSIGAAAQRIEVRVVNRRRRNSVWIVGGTMGGGWSGGGGRSPGGGGSSGGGSGGGSFGGGSFGGGSFGGGSFGGGSFGGGGGTSRW